ncbi:MAG TPA: N-succinylarginine dihydrolase [Polyangiaceae bacterium]
MTARELNFDGLVGPTHHYAGLSPGNLASQRHAGEVANPRAAALQGLEKMRFVAGLGVGQAVLPPQPRPDLGLLRRLGFSGSDRAVLAHARRIAPDLLSAASSASAMWAANAATVAPSSDTGDGRVHFVPANLVSMLHRSIEAETTARVLERIFGDRKYFEVHDPLPAAKLFSDEGAANHTRLATSGGSVHLFGWGRARGVTDRPRAHPARQTREASEALARLLHLPATTSLFWQQSPLGIDAGAFHSDVLAVGNERVFLLHESAFRDYRTLLGELGSLLGDELSVVLASERELPLQEAVASYPFNSQLLTLPDGAMAIVAPREAEESAAASAYLARVVAEAKTVSTVHYVDVNGSMRNGGGPACLRLRVRLEPHEEQALRGRVLYDAELHRELTRCVSERYRDLLTVDDLADPAFLDESRTALDEITTILGLGSVYDFQR